MALSENARIDTRNKGGMTQLTPVVRTSAIIFQGSLCVIDAAGVCAPAANVVASETFAGIALDTSENTFPVTGDGTRTVDLFSNLDARLTLVTLVTVSNIGDNMFAFDDERVTDLTTRGNAIGVLVTLEGSTDGWVRLGAAALAVSI